MHILGTCTQAVAVPQSGQLPAPGPGPTRCCPAWRPMPLVPPQVLMLEAPKAMGSTEAAEAAVRWGLADWDAGAQGIKG